MNAKTPALQIRNVALIDIEGIVKLSRKQNKEPRPQVNNRLDRPNDPRETVSIRCIEYFKEKGKQCQSQGRIASITFPAVKYDGQYWLVWRGKRPGRIEHFTINGSEWIPTKSKWWPKSLRDFLAVIRNAAFQSQKQE